VAPPVFSLGSRGQNSHFTFHSVRPPVERTGVAAWPSSAGTAIPGFPVVEGPDGVRGRPGIDVETLDAAPPPSHTHPSHFLLSLASLLLSSMLPPVFSFDPGQGRTRPPPPPLICRRSCTPLLAPLLGRKAKGGGRIWDALVPSQPSSSRSVREKDCAAFSQSAVPEAGSKGSNGSRRRPRLRLQRDGTC
jgi:hypothetical protein